MERHDVAFSRISTAADVLALVTFCANGCSSPLFLAQSPDVSEFEKLVDEEDQTKFVGESGGSVG